MPNKRMKWSVQPHPSHKMGSSFTDIKSPSGTPRFYITRKCVKCSAEQSEHVAGKFIDPELKVKCVFTDE